MNAEQQKIIDELREQGYAVTIFTPEELGDVSADSVEDDMVSSGWNTINELK